MTKKDFDYKKAEKERKKRRKKRRAERESEQQQSTRLLYKLLMLVCLAVFFFALYKVVDIVMEYRAIDKYYEETQEDYLREGDDIPNVDFEKLLSVNDDVVGWLYLKDTGISYPILHGPDNNYYLYHNYEKEWLGAGSIFMEANNAADFRDDHTVVFGHNMRNGSMFGGLDKFFEEDYLEAHPYINVLLPGDVWLEYEIVSVYTAEVEDGTFEVFDENEEAYAKYNSLIDEKNIYAWAVENDGRQILTLSTCTEDSNYAKRNVLQAKLVREMKKGADGKWQPATTETQPATAETQPEEK